MNRKEISMLIGLFEARYVNFKVENLEATVEAWYMDLKDIPASVIGQAFEVYRFNNPKGFAPSLDQLLDLANKVDEMNELTPLEAWTLVDKALRNSSRNAQAEFDKLPPLVQKTLRSPSTLYYWGQTDLVVVETSIAKQFQSNYEIVAKRAREMKRTPEVFKALTQQTLAQLPQWENPEPIVQAVVNDNRADAESIDRHMDRLKALLGGA